MSRWSVTPIPLLQNNYCYVLSCLATKATAVVDVAHTCAPKVLAALKELNVTDFKVLSTHKHSDHAGGNIDMAKLVPNLTIIGGVHDNIPGVTIPVKDGDEFSVGELRVRVLHTPCHTTGHVLYHAAHPADENNGCIFTGDTIFVAGVGAFFEGNARDMLSAMKRVALLPPDTKMYCGHEYTVNFLEAALKLEPDNADMKTMLAWCVQQRAAGLTTMGTRLGDELKYNIYMRSMGKELQGKMGISDETELLQKVYDNT